MIQFIYVELIQITYVYTQVFSTHLFQLSANREKRMNEFPVNNFLQLYK